MRSLILTLAIAAYAPLAFSAPAKLTVSTSLGVHQPGLEDLSQHEFQAPIAGVADVIVGTGDNQSSNILFPNPLPEIDMGVNAGLEFIWTLSDKYDFIVGGSTWEATSRALSSGQFFLQGRPADVINERTGKISYNEFYFGLRYNLITSPKEYRAYYRLTLNEVFDIDYREDLIFLFTSGDAEGVKKSMILQSQATGLMMLQPGIGVEYFVSDWFSFGMDASYVVGMRRVTLRDGKSTVDFLPTDNLSLWLPQRVDPASGDLQYLSPTPQSNDDYTKIRLSFDGWKLLFRFNIHF